MNTCSRCSGTGRWVNPGDSADIRKCFACNGMGEREVGLQPAQARTLRPGRTSRSTRGFPGADFFTNVTLGDGDGPSGEGASTSAPIDATSVAKDVATRITPLIRAEVSEQVTKSERDIKGWAKVELDVIQHRIEDAVYARVAKRVPLQVELTRNGVKVPDIEGHQHPSFAKLLRLATSRDTSGFVPNIWVTGPAGSGKTTGARMLAKALELPFFYNGALETKFEVIGYSDAGGKYHTTAFREAMEQPSVYLFDDIDSCDSNAPLLALNGALANGLIAFPDKHVERHRDSIVIATANTWGLGATADYVGRTRLDGAFTDRFGGKVTWGYDEEFERAISGNPTWTVQVQRARAKAAQAGLKVLITPRASIAGAAYIAAGFTAQEAAELTYLANLSPEQRKILQ